MTSLKFNVEGEQGSAVTAIRSYLHDIAGTFEDEISARPTREARIRRR
jgi:hypothetical protein